MKGGIKLEGRDPGGQGKCRCGLSKKQMVLGSNPTIDDSLIYLMVVVEGMVSNPQVWVPIKSPKGLAMKGLWLSKKGKWKVPQVF